MINRFDFLEIEEEKKIDKREGKKFFYQEQSELEKIKRWFMETGIEEITNKSNFSVLNKKDVEYIVKLIKNSKWDQGIKYCEKLETKFSNTPMLYYYWSIFLYEAGQFDYSLVKINKAIELEKTENFISFKKIILNKCIIGALEEAYFYMINFEYLRSTVRLKEIYETYSKERDFLNIENFILLDLILLKCLWNLEAYNEGFDVCDRLISTAPYISEPYYFLTVFADKLNKKDMVIKAGQKFFDLYQGNDIKRMEQVLLPMADAMIEKRDLSSPIKYLEMIINLDSNNPLALMKKEKIRTIKEKDAKSKPVESQIDFSVFG